MGKLEIVRRDSFEERLEPLGSLIIAGQFTAPLLSHHIQLVAVAAQGGREEAQRTGSQSNRLRTLPAQPTGPFANRPYVSDALVGGLEEEIAAIRRPIPAAFSLSIAPPRNQRTQAVAVTSDLP